MYVSILTNWVYSVALPLVLLFVLVAGRTVVKCIFARVAIKGESGSAKERRWYNLGKVSEQKSTETGLFMQLISVYLKKQNQKQLLLLLAGSEAATSD